MKKLLAILLLALYGLPLQAETVRYVSDKLEVPLRSGKSRQHKILRMLPVGSKILVLSTENDGYSKIQDGELEGWILTRYLMDKPSAKARLSKLEQQLAEVELKNNGLQEKIKSLSDLQSARDEKVAKLSKQNLKLKQDNASVRQMASNTLAIANDNKQLKIEIKKVRRELETSRQESVRLKDTASKEWFIYGAGVAVICLIIGMFFPRVRTQSRSSW